VVTSLPEIGPRHYRAASYEALVDAPIVAGNAKMYSFDVDGIQHALVNIGGDRTQWDGPQSMADLARIVRAQRDTAGFFPYKRYLFLNVLSGKGGGMEHQECTVMMTSPDATRRRETYVRWMGLASHELFHAWNVKSLRPREITPGEYEEEQYTRSLGIAEGFTSYYGVLSLRRAGVISEAEFFDELSKLVEGLQRSEGRRVQSLADSSFDTWIKFYRPNENSPRTTVSYYTKGAVVAFVLDARIQAASRGQRTLDKVMNEMLRRYPRERGYTLDDFAEVAGVDIKPYFFTTDELDYKEAAAWFGLKISSTGKVEPQGRNAHRDEWLSGKRQ
jgi:predicted metalloprotease with PDZ domain